MRGRTVLSRLARFSITSHRVPGISNLPTAFRERNQSVPGIPISGATGAGMLSVVEVTIRPIAMARAAAMTICKAEPGSFKLSITARANVLFSRMGCSWEEAEGCWRISSSERFLDSSAGAPLSAGAEPDFSIMLSGDLGSRTGAGREAEVEEKWRESRLESGNQ